MTDILIFDRARVRENRNRSAARGGTTFLHDWAARSLSDRLRDVRRSFPLALSLGAAGAQSFSGHEKIDSLITSDLAEGRLKQADGPRVQADEELLPFARASLDLILSPLTLQSVNDLPGALVQIRQALKPDGLFSGAMLGGETLHELRNVMTEAEMTLRGGISPRISPLAGQPQMGDLLQRAGFALPVIDSEIVTVTYDNAFGLMHDLRIMGEGNTIIRRDKTIPPRALFMETAHLYQERFSDPDGRIRASFDVIFLTGWSPHASQQQPLKRGSATHSLADVL